MRIRVDLAYDGTAFHGWAAQRDLRTVQGELERALATALRVPEVATVCAGRTDTGVHARGQVAHADLDAAVLVEAAGRSPAGPLDSLTRRLNGLLPDDVSVHRVTEAAAGFDARFSAVWRRYAYRLADHPGAVDPLARRHVVRWPRALDLEAMNEAACHLVGEHDFAAFCKHREGATTIRRVLELSWERDDRGVATATVRADAFCHHMVRSLMGCLVAVGEHRRDPGWAADILRAAVRDSAVANLPAHGLTLEEVGYPADADLAVRAAEARRVRTL